MKRLKIEGSSALPKYVHVVLDQKFIPSAMEMFEEACPGQSRWIILSEPFDVEHVNPATIEFISPHEFSRRDWRGCIVFIHMMTPAARLAVLSTDTAAFVWIVYGADLYPHILGYHQLFAPETRTLVPNRGGGVKTRVKSLLAFAFPATLVRIAGRLTGSRALAERLARAVPIRRIIERCRGLIFVAPTEADFVRRHLPGVAFESFNWNYARAFSVDQQNFTVRREDEAVMIGNSAAPEGNHLDCINLVLEAGRALDVYLPLSYGNEAYKTALLARLPQASSYRFHVLHDFLPIAAYQAVQARCCYVVMGHRRQQAAGNVNFALALGARVYLHPDNPLLSHYRNLGLTVFELRDVVEHCRAGAGWLDEDTTARNREIILANYGRPAAVAKTRRLAEQLESLHAGGDCDDAQPENNQFFRKALSPEAAASSRIQRTASAGSTSSLRRSASLRKTP